MKRIVLFLAIGLFLLSACSDGSTATETQAVTPAPTQSAAPAAVTSDCATLGPQADGSICSATCQGGNIVRVVDETSCTPWDPPATAAPEAWPRPVVRTDDLGNGNFINWFEEPSYSAVFLMAAPVALSDGPLPIGEAVIGGMLFYVWYQTVGQEALVAAGAEVANGLEDLKLKIQAKAAPDFVDIDWAQWPPAWLTVLHPESPELIAGAWMRSTNGTLQSNNPQGCESGAISSGSVCLFAALNDPGTGQQFEGSVAVLVGSGPHVAFLVINGQVRPTPPAPGEMGWERLGQSQYYFQKSSGFWKCAWWMAQKTAGNGKKAVPPELRLDAGTGWARWQEVKTRYGLVFPIASISLPANPFQ